MNRRAEGVGGGRGLYWSAGAGCARATPDLNLYAGRRSFSLAKHEAGPHPVFDEMFRVEEGGTVPRAATSGCLTATQPYYRGPTRNKLGVFYEVSVL